MLGGRVVDLVFVVVVVTVPHVICTASALYVPKHGSPNTVLSADTLHDDAPTHKLLTTDTELAALHEVLTCSPAVQLPVGVP